jgi:Autotransporter beta-domain
MRFRRWGGLLAITLVLAGRLTAPAHAQNALCPTSFAGQAGILFQGSSCTNSVTGAYSNSALASESLSQFTQSSSDDTTKATMGAISDRRKAEAQPCPEGLIRINGACAPSTTASRFAPEDPPNSAWTSMPTTMLSIGPTMPLVTKAPAFEPTARVAVWTQAYGEYQRLNGQSPGLGEFSVLGLNAKSASWAGGLLGGADATFRNVASAGDGLIVGALAGYESSQVSVSTASISSNSSTPNGSSTMKAQLSGPVTGLYASYFNGRFSADLAFQVEFYDLNLSFNDLLGFQANPGANFPATSVPFSGSGSTWLNIYTASGNVNYEIPIDKISWVEPTVGLAYAILSYGPGADQFALADGSVTRLQAGARFGVEGAWDGMRMTTIVTGLLWDNVSVAGGVFANAANPLILADQGKLRAEGIVALNFYQPNGVSYLLLVDVQGGEGLFAVGAKAGVRAAW